MLKCHVLKNGLVVPRDDDWEALEELRLNIVKGNLDDLRRCIEQGLSPDKALRGDWSPLMYACSLGHHDIVDFLLKKGADPNFHKDHFTPLMAACTSSRDEGKLLECVKLLLHYGAVIDAVDPFNVTPLMFASREGHILIVKHLVKENANISLRDNRGWTALFWAINSGRTSVMKYLLKAESAEYVKKSGLPPTHKGYKRNKEICDLVHDEIHLRNEKDSTHSDESISLPCSSDVSSFNDNEDCLKTISQLEMHLYKDYTTISLMQTSLQENAFSKPMPAKHLVNKTREALKASECVYNQMRFLHDFTSKLSETDEVIPADFLVEKKVTVRTETWPTVIITTIVVAVTFWKTDGFRMLPSILPFSGT